MQVRTSVRILNIGTFGYDFSGKYRSLLCNMINNGECSCAMRMQISDNSRTLLVLRIFDNNKFLEINLICFISINFLLIINI